MEVDKLSKLKWNPKTQDPKLCKTIKELADDFTTEMKAIYGNNMMIKDICEYLKCSKTYAAQFVENLTFVPIGKSKRFRTLDIARKLAEIQCKNIA